MTKELEKRINNLPEHIEYKIYRYAHEMVFTSVMMEMRVKLLVRSRQHCLDNWDCSPSEYSDSTDGYDEDAEDNYGYYEPWT